MTLKHFKKEVAVDYPRRVHLLLVVGYNKLYIRRNVGDTVDSFNAHIAYFSHAFIYIRLAALSAAEVERDIKCFALFGKTNERALAAVRKARAGRAAVVEGMQHRRRP